jgi:hypothetical protein
MKITTTYHPDGRVATIKGLIPTTKDEDFAEMRRVWNAQSNAKNKPYTRKSILLASGGEKQSR